MSYPVSAISPDSFSSFGELLRYLRKRAELSQRELALHVGYHYSYLSRIENNEHVPDSAMLMARFIPALGLEKEPAWTRRLLELATLGGRTASIHAENRTVLSGGKDPSEIAEPDFTSDLFPVSLTPLLGRRSEVESLLQLISRSEARLVTLVGPPGVGKTRLAIQTATEAVGMFAHGLKFIDLAPITQTAHFLPALAQHLGVNELAEMPLITRVAQALRQKNILLVMDNFEQLVEAAPQVYQLLSSTVHVKALVTSRVPLHITGETLFTVPPLSLPLQRSESDAQGGSSEFMGFSAIQLFVERACAVQPDFQLTPENSGAILEICKRLDGLPLAIELAAARVRALSPQAMLNAFESRFDWLAPNNREEQSSKQTLRGTIDWSYTLLTEKEQVLLRRLSVFSGGRTAETVKAVCVDDEVPGEKSTVPADEVFDLLIQLTDKSLLYTEHQSEEARFYLLETIHEFASEKLKQTQEEVQFRNRHLAYFCGIAERVELEIEYENQTVWLNRCEIEHNNMRSALDWSLQEEADLQTGVRMAASLGLFWYLHSHFVEGLERSKIFLKKARELDDKRVLAKLLFRTADLHLHRAELETAVHLAEEAVVLCQDIDDKPLLAWALYVLGDIYLARQDLSAAEITLTQGIDVCREIQYEAVEDISLLLLGTILLREGKLERAYLAVNQGLALAEKLSDKWSIASGFQALGEIFLHEKKYDVAQKRFEQSLEASRQVGDKFIMGGDLVNLAVLTNLQGQFEESDHFAEQALAIFQLVGDETQQCLPLRVMGYASIHEGNYIRARVLLRESLLSYTHQQNKAGQLACLVGMACCSLAEGDMPNAVMFCALAYKHSQERGYNFHELDLAAFESVMTQCRNQLGKATYESFYKQGEVLFLEETLSRLLG